MKTMFRTVGPLVAAVALFAAAGFAVAAPADQTANPPAAAAQGGPGSGWGPGGGMGMGMGGRGGMMGGGHMGRGMGMGMGGGGMGGGLFTMTLDQGRVDALKTSLGIRANQETAWNGYVKALQEMNATMQSMRRGVDPASVRAMAPADRQNLMAQHQAQRQDSWTKVSTAAAVLIAALDDGQRAKAQQELPGWGGGCAMGGGRGMGRW